MPILECRTYEKPWRDDKILLRPFGTLVDVDWDNDSIREREYDALEQAYSRLLTDPTNPIEATQETVEGIVRALFPLIEREWGSEGRIVPGVEVVPIEEWKARFVEAQRQELRALGLDYEPVDCDPPLTALYPHTGKLLVANHVIPFDNSDLAQLVQPRTDLQYVQWDRELLETALCDALTVAMFCQERGEWGDKYIEAMDVMNAAFGESLDHISTALRTMTRERIAGRSHPQWGFYVVAGKFAEVYSNPTVTGVYCALRGAVCERGLGTIAQIDKIHGVSVANGTTKIEYGLNPRHPNYPMKQLLLGAVAPNA